MAVKSGLEKYFWNSSMRKAFIGSTDLKMTRLHKFLGCYLSSQRLSQISPTANFDGAAIPPPIFSMSNGIFQFVLRRWPLTIKIQIHVQMMNIHTIQKVFECVDFSRKLLLFLTPQRWKKLHKRIITIVHVIVSQFTKGLPQVPHSALYQHFVQP